MEERIYSSKSARIRRRNAFGYKGNGTLSDWRKTTEFGTLERKDLHELRKEYISKMKKHDGKLPEDNTYAAQFIDAYNNERVKQDVAKYRHFNPQSKHVGSKTYAQMAASIRRN